MAKNNSRGKTNNALRQAFRSYAENVAKFLPEMEFLRREIARTRSESHVLFIKHENACRNMQLLDLENKQLKAQLEVAVAAARKTEAFNLENRSSFVIQKVQVETSQKERDILEERIIKLQFENVTLKSRVHYLEDQCRNHEKNCQTDEILDHLKTGAHKAAEILERERDNLLKWINQVKELAFRLSNRTAEQRRLIKDLMAGNRAPKEKVPDQCTETDATNLPGFVGIKEKLMDMHLRLAEALNKSASYEALLNQTISCMVELTKQKNELKLRIQNMEDETDHSSNKSKESSPAILLEDEPEKLNDKVPKSDEG